jgi:penicillin-binding protein 1A
MVLGSSEVRLIDLTRAYAAVENKGVGVMPYAITRVVTADGRLLYRHENSEDRVLVAPWVAAEMTDLLQTAVLSGTGRAAQIGRPVAGKTGTTSSNKDGWFLGFSSGLTTGVWMGRDDARPIPGLQGGTAPAKAFHDYMVVAVANRPVEQFETEVPMPDWQLSPEEDLNAAFSGNEPLVDADGNPLPSQQLDPLGAQPDVAQPPQPQPPGSPDQTELDRIFGGTPPPREGAPPPVDRAPPPPSAPADQSQRRPDFTQ